LGGKPTRQTTSVFGATAHWPGSPQGRSFAEAGPHGCTIVQVDAMGAARDRFVPTDVVRWHGQSLPIDATVSLEQVRTMLDETIRTAGVTNGGVEVLARWRISAAGAVSPSLRREGVIADLLRVARHNYKTTTRVWTEHVTIDTDVTIDLPDPSRDTVLADFLRIADRFDAEPTNADSEKLFDFDHAAALLGETREWADVLRVDDVGRRRRLLRQAAVLAHDLLAEEVER